MCFRARKKISGGCFIGFTIEILTKIPNRKNPSDFFFELEKNILLELKKIIVDSSHSENSYLSIGAGLRCWKSTSTARPALTWVNPSQMSICSTFPESASECEIEVGYQILRFVKKPDIFHFTEQNCSKLCERMPESLWIHRQSKDMLFLIRNCTPTFFPTPKTKIFFRSKIFFEKKSEHFPKFEKMFRIFSENIWSKTYFCFRSWKKVGV